MNCADENFLVKTLFLNKMEKKKKKNPYKLIVIFFIILRATIVYRYFCVIKIKTINPEHKQKSHLTA